jgi:hypothetical protein
MNQKEAYEMFFPCIESQGKIYSKTSLVYARKATSGEFIETWTSDGLETTNYAKEGDFVLKNLNTQSQEEYIVTEEMCIQRYDFLYQTENGHILKPKGKVRATVYHGSDMEFVASWGRNMVLKTGDMIVSPCPNFSEVYRIARQEFDETYKID